MKDINNLINYYGRNTFSTFRTVEFDALWEPDKTAKGRK